jgi:hypothetical protein
MIYQLSECRRHQRPPVDVNKSEEGVSISNTLQRKHIAAANRCINRVTVCRNGTFKRWQAPSDVQLRQGQFRTFLTALPRQTLASCLRLLQMLTDHMAWISRQPAHSSDMMIESDKGKQLMQHACKPVRLPTGSLREACSVVCSAKVQLLSLP